MTTKLGYFAQFTGLAVIALGTAVFAQDAANRLANADSTFAMNAAAGGLAEVQLGQLAVQNAADPSVKAFGQKMVDDHSKANDQLKAIAAQKGVTLPGSMTAQDQATYDRLAKLKGADFDRAYMADMVKDHRTDIAEFEKEASGGSDPDLKSFAANTLPTLKEHLQMAESTNAKVKK
jgi:putative membrane protein